MAGRAAVFFTHLIAPYMLREGTPGALEASVVFASWQRAAMEARKKGIEVEFLACTLPKDEPAVPSWARKASPLTYYAIDSSMHELPTVAEIWKRGVDEGRGRYLVYTNMDIGTHPNFYIHAHQMLINSEEHHKSHPSSPRTALEFTRLQVMRLERDAKAPPALEDVFTFAEASRHPGHDCFVVPKDIVPPNLLQGGLVVGMPPWGTAYHHEISNHPGLRLLFMQGTRTSRYTFHLGVEGSTEAWMENQDFRLQQYSEAFRIFGPDVVSRAWGAKGRHSPFYYLCNATYLRYPACDFCEAFYPSSQYPELTAHRECRGIMTDRSFYAHLPYPHRTERADLSRLKQNAKASSGKAAGGVVIGDFRTRSSDNGAGLADAFEHHEPCKIKCIQEKQKCHRLTTRSLFTEEERKRLRYDRPPLLWHFPGSEPLWLRLFLELATRRFTASLLPEGSEAVRTGAASVLKHPTSNSSIPPSTSTSSSSSSLSTSSPFESASSLSCADGSSLLVHASATALSPLEHPGGAVGDREARIQPPCRSLPPFATTVAVVRNPYQGVWAEYYHQWMNVNHPAPPGPRKGPLPRGPPVPVVLKFMRADDLDSFSARAVRLAAVWRRTHADLLAFRSRRPDAVHVLRFEDLLAARSGDLDSAAAALASLADFLGIPRPTHDLVHCAVVLGQRALTRDLSPQQKATSQDQLYDGATVCKMWAIFGDVATALGYDQPFNHMPCESLSSSTSARAEAKAEADVCGWFQWMRQGAETGLGQWARRCAAMGR